MDRTQIVLVVILVIALIAAFPTVRLSKKRERIYGGVMAETFHFLGVVAYLAVLPAALLGSLLIGPLRFGIPLALSCLALALLCLVAYGVIEQPARVGVTVEDRGWTEEDARSSGL